MTMANPILAGRRLMQPSEVEPLPAPEIEPLAAHIDEHLLAAAVGPSHQAALEAHLPIEPPPVPGEAPRVVVCRKRGRPRKSATAVLAGRRLQQVRKTLGLTLRDVEGTSRHVSRLLGNPDLQLSISRICEIERGAVPTLFNLHPMCVIYGLEHAEVLQLYGLDRVTLPPMEPPAVEPLPTATVLALPRYCVTDPSTGALHGEHETLQVARAAVARERLFSYQIWREGVCVEAWPAQSDREAIGRSN